MTLTFRTLFRISPRIGALCLRNELGSASGPLLQVGEEAQAGGSGEGEALSPRVPTLEPREVPGEADLIIGSCRFVCTFPICAHTGVGWAASLPFPGSLN